jgi:hypothetical protein
MTRARSLSQLANSNVFSVDADNSRVGIGSTVPTVKLDVGGDMNVSGTLTYEDVTNVETTGIITAAQLVVTGVGATFAGISTFLGDIQVGDKIIHTGDTNTAIRFPAADTFTVETGGSERIRIRSNGVIIKGNSGTQETVGNGANTQLIGSGSADASLALIRQASGGGEFYFAAGTSGTNIADDNGLGFIKFMGYHTNGYDEYARIEAFVDGTNGDGDAPGRLIFKTSADGAASPTERLRIDSSGTASFAGDVSIADKIIHTGDTDTAIRFPQANTFAVETGGTEAYRVDSSRRILLGHTSSRAIGHASGDGKLQIEGTNLGTSELSIVRNSDNNGAAHLFIGKSRGSSVGDSTVVQNNDSLGVIGFVGADGTDLQTRAAQITAVVDGAPGSNDMPGALLFSTTADGANSPTERLRISSGGQVRIGTQSGSDRTSHTLQVSATGSDSLLSLQNFSNSDGSEMDIAFYALNTNNAVTKFAQIVATADETQANSTQEGSLKFSVNIAASMTDVAKFNTNGHFVPASNDTYDLGGTSTRWRNIYTGDLNLSNEGSANDVDGTWGDYTIQEGENDLFLLNKRNGKKFKFMLQEVN